MIYEFIGHDGQRVSTTDEGEATELMNALGSHNFEVETFDPASNGADTVYRSPEDEEKDRCYSAWGYH